MGMFDTIKNSTSGALGGTTEREPNPTQTLEVLKKQVSVNCLTYNKYNNYWFTHIDSIDVYKKRAQVVDNCANGVGEFYDNVVNDDVIHSMVKNISNETLNDITFNILVGEELIEKRELQRIDKTTKLFLSKDTFKRTFEYLYLYEKIGVKIDIFDGQYRVTPLKPYEYNIDSMGTIEIINGFDAKGQAITEKRASSGNFNYVDGVETDGTYFYEFCFDSRLYSKLELILDYQLANSNETKEVELNKTKIFIDKKMYRGKLINKELIQLINIPKTISDKTDSINSYFNTVASKNSLNDIGGVTERKAKKMVSGFRMSRKTLGLSESADFASSLPYENELTAKTINEYRNQFSQILTSLISQLLKRQDIVIDMGKYKLTSKEAILDQNIKSTQSQSESINTKVANVLDKNKEDHDVIVETLKIKIENNITMTLEEEIQAGELGLMPSLMPTGFEG